MITEATKHAPNTVERDANARIRGRKQLLSHRQRTLAELEAFLVVSEVTILLPDAVEAGGNVLVEGTCGQQFQINFERALIVLEALLVIAEAGVSFANPINGGAHVLVLGGQHCMRLEIVLEALVAIAEHAVNLTHAVQNLADIRVLGRQSFLVDGESALVALEALSF